MSNYTTVRIDNETMKKLEEILKDLQQNNIGKISKALAMKLIIDEEYERRILNKRTTTGINK